VTPEGGRSARGSATPSRGAVTPSRGPAPPERAATALRSDAARNRDALIDAARSVFGRRGLNAPLDDIARQAGIGNATLYRHFPTRCDLIAAVFTTALQDVVVAAERALANPDPWDAFADHFLFLCELQAKDRGMADLLTMSIPGASELEKARRQAQEGLARIVARARESGDLRPDFEIEDIGVLLMANAGLIHRTASGAPTAWRRMVAYFLDGLHDGAPAVPLPPSPGLRAVRAAMANQSAHFGCT
jgi:AcrR family transcriptional regulator